MKKFYVLMLTVFLNVPFFYSCTPDAANADDSLYTEQANTGDDDGEILPPEEDDCDDPDGCS
ncbi:hypothetical protein SAMN05216480_10672 [Pustulibacterium marinum]|uniref:Secreted protein n=2 Tax=Pustulibacterium marinum TaxID=1224947 RepID=A0A1I7GXN6_9FLAO|nr:hypothetical protein SAMN05216480_10672 [Pustulibacterium marinum]